jgi:hypothetical protein
MKTFKGRVRPLTAIFAMLVTVFLPKSALAWGNTGHEAVAFVAWQLMNPTARAKAMELIRLVPQLTSPSGKQVNGFPQWQAALPPGLSSDDQNQFLFMRAATWPDSIKHVGFHDSDDPPPNVAVDHPIGFTDTASHGYWHFVDKGLTSDPSKVPAPAPNAAVQIVELRKDLASDTDPKLRAYELIWLLHLVGDIHQPLHGARRFVGGKSDLGANLVKITLSKQLNALFLANRPTGAPGSPPKELHAFWDDLPGVTSDPALALKPAADFGGGLAAASSDDVNNTVPGSWADKSFDIAVQDAYVTPVGPGNSDAQGHGFVMTPAYYDKALSDGKAQIALAGARLAKMLNDIWPAQVAANTKK